MPFGQARACWRGRLGIPQYVLRGTKDVRRAISYIWDANAGTGSSIRRTATSWQTAYACGAVGRAFPASILVLLPARHRHARLKSRLVRLTNYRYVWSRNLWSWLTMCFRVPIPPHLLDLWHLLESKAKKKKEILKRKAADTGLVCFVFFLRLEWTWWPETDPEMH